MEDTPITIPADAHLVQSAENMVDDVEQALKPDVNPEFAQPEPKTDEMFQQKLKSAEGRLKKKLEHEYSAKIKALEAYKTKTEALSEAELNTVLSELSSKNPTAFARLEKATISLSALEKTAIFKTFLTESIPVFSTPKVQTSVPHIPSRLQRYINRGK